MGYYESLKEQRRRDEEREFYELKERVRELDRELRTVEEYLGINVEKVPEHYECKKVKE